MDKEREILVSALREVFMKLGVRTVLYDFDDTLVDTSLVFRTAMKTYTSSIATHAFVDAERVYKTLGDTIRGLRTTFHVDPVLMAESARITALTYGVPFDSPQVQKAQQELMRIYDGNEVVAHEGALKTVSLVRGTGVDNLLVTHGSEHFTVGKLKATGFDRHFPRSQVECLDTTKPKDALAWNEVLTRRGINPHECILLGDNWSSDIVPALEIGIPKGNVFRVRTNYDHANSNPVEGIREINGVRELPGVLLGLR